MALVLREFGATLPLPGVSPHCLEGKFPWLAPSTHPSSTLGSPGLASLPARACDRRLLGSPQKTAALLRTTQAVPPARPVPVLLDVLAFLAGGGGGGLELAVNKNSGQEDTALKNPFNSSEAETRL